MKLLSLIQSKLQKKDGESAETEKKPLNTAVVILLIGLLLIMIPSLFTGKSTKKSDVKSETDIMSVRENEETRLEKILSKIDGVKSVTVLISYNDSGSLEAFTEEKTVFKNQNSKDGNGENESQTERKPVFDGDKNIAQRKRYMPGIKGVSIFYSGEKSEETENKLYRAAHGALGIELHKTEVIHTSKN